MTVLPGTYQLKTSFHNIDGVVKQDFVSVTIWGVPTEEAHNRWRWTGGGPLEGKFGASSTNARVPYLASPTSCTGEPMQATFLSVSWQEPYAPPSEATPLLAPLNDCDRWGCSPRSRPYRPPPARTPRRG